MERKFGFERGKKRMERIGAIDGLQRQMNLKEREHARKIKEFEGQLKEAERTARQKQKEMQEEHAEEIKELKRRTEEAEKAAEKHKRNLLEAVTLAGRHQKYGQDTYNRLVEVKDAAKEAKSQVMKIDGHLNRGRFRIPKLKEARAAVKKAQGILENIV